MIVHGGGPEVSALSQQLDIEVQWNGGRRVTSEAALNVATMVLTWPDQQAHRARVARGGRADAIGISGEDAALVSAQVTQGGALGRVGEVVPVRTQRVAELLDLGLVPVISPISTGRRRRSR